MSSIQVLIVEDEFLIREELKSALENGGYTVTEADSAEAALTMLDGEGAAFAAVVTDINLKPGKLTGWDVAKHARERTPSMPIVYATATSADEWASKGVPNSVLIAKPYADAQVLTAVSQLLNAIASSPTATPG